MKAKRRRPPAAKPPASASATIAAQIARAVARLKRAKLAYAHGTTDPVAEAAFLVGETLGIPPARIERHFDTPVTPRQARKIAALVEGRIKTRKPAAYLLHRIYMRGVPFYIDQRAIVPRSYLGEILESDELDALLNRGRGAVKRVLDLCTGSGCLAILAARRFPKGMVDATDISGTALAVARRNVADHKLQRRVRLLRGDLYDQVASECYDLILANPPYVDARGMKRLPAECRHEPAIAFDGGDDGLSAIRRIVEGAGRHLSEGGGLLCEIGRGRKRLERAYPRLPFLWLDTEASTGEVFWLDAAALR